MRGYDILKERIAEEVIQPGYMNWWRASEAGACEVLLWHTKMRHKSLPIGGRVRHLLEDGNVHERDIAERLVRCGFDVRNTCLDGQAELVVSRKPHVVGHPDGFVTNPYPYNDEGYDYVEDGFDYTCSEYLLEITAPSHFNFLRLQRLHAKEVLWQKYVQIHMYLHASKLSSAILIAKNKNTSELYEEGIAYDAKLVSDTFDKLSRIDEGKVPDYRCDDWRRNYCRYRHLCFGVEETVTLLGSDILRGESLAEAEHLIEVAEVWKKGKLLKVEGEELVDDSREQFAEIIREYGCRGLTVNDVKALMIGAGTNRRTDYDLLRQRYPVVYSEVVAESVRGAYVRVSD